MIERTLEGKKERKVFNCRPGSFILRLNDPPDEKGDLSWNISIDCIVLTSTY